MTSIASGFGTYEDGRASGGKGLRGGDFEAEGSHELAGRFEVFRSGACEIDFNRLFEIRFEGVEVRRFRVAAGKFHHITDEPSRFQVSFYYDGVCMLHVTVPPS